MDFQGDDTKAWIYLLGRKSEHVEFTGNVSESLQLYFQIEQGIENGWNYAKVYVL